MSKKKVVIATPQSQEVNVEDEINKELEEGVDVEETEEEEDIEEDDEEDAEPEAPVVVVPDVVIQEETVIPDTSKIPEKNVRVKVRVNHHCSIGGEEYNLTAGQCYNVPVSVKKILNKAGLLSPL